MAKLFIYCIITQFFSMIYSNKLFLLECSQFKRNRRNISHFAEKKRPWNQALMLDRQTLRVWLRGANIETGGVREGGKNVSVNGILQPNARGN